MRSSQGTNALEQRQRGCTKPILDRIQRLPPNSTVAVPWHSPATRITKRESTVHEEITGRPRLSQNGRVLLKNHADTYRVFLGNVQPTNLFCNPDALHDRCEDDVHDSNAVPKHERAACPKSQYPDVDITHRSADAHQDTVRSPGVSSLCLRVTHHIFLYVLKTSPVDAGPRGLGAAARAAQVFGNENALTSRTRDEMHSATTRNIHPGRRERDPLLPRAQYTPLTRVFDPGAESPGVVISCSSPSGPAGECRPCERQQHKK